MTNLKRGDQPDELFELPPGAQPFAGMDHVMEMMRGASAPASTNDAEAQPQGTDVMMEEAIKGLGNIFGR